MHYQNVTCKRVCAHIHHSPVKDQYHCSSGSECDPGDFYQGHLLTDQDACKHKDKYRVQYVYDGRIHRRGQVQTFIKQSLVGSKSQEPA